MKGATKVLNFPKYRKAEMILSMFFCCYKKYTSNFCAEYYICLSIMNRGIAMFLFEVGVFVE